MTEQNGIDILCNAAGSDLLLSSIFPSDAESHQTQTQQQQQQQQQPPPPQKKVKRNEPSPPVAASVAPFAPSSNHICHICKRVYERADHLTRHLRSHENARPYPCTRCPKRFNRADLLTRHEATHDRDAGKSKPFIRRSDRAAQACEACASAKAKCDDQKPCGRCRAKKLACKASTRRPYPHKTSIEGDSPSESGTVASAMSNNVPPAQVSMHEAMEPTPFMPDVMGQNASLIDPRPDDMVYFNPMSDFLQDMDFTMSWDMNFDAFSIPQFDRQGPSPQSSTSHPVTRPSPRNAIRDSSRGHSAFKRSPWLWDPKKEDYVQQQKEGLHIDEQSISQSPGFGKLMDRPSRRLRMTAHQRDRIFSIVLAQNRDPSKVPSFPTLDLLNYLLQAHFVQDEHQFDSWIHPASFDPEKALPELLAAIISSGASFISVPAIWQFGLAMHEVVRLGVSDLFEKHNAHTRNLSALQTFMLTLDVGIWSGFKRKMEIAESFLQPLLTMLRRAGAFSAPADSPALLPLDSDSPGALEAKWKKFVSRESYKRLILHLFSHDVQTSISLQRNPLISFSELAFTLPSSRDLWCAPTAEAWRQVHLSKTTMPRPLPRVSEVLHCVDVLDELEEFIDIDLCYSAVLNGYWGQVWAYRESVRFFATASRGGTNRLWLKSQHQELYQDLSGFSSIIHTSNTPRNHSTLLAIVVELFLMIMHVSPDEIQRFAGKSGEEESRRAGTSLEETWANTSDARHAIWHAGQVFANAKRLPPASLRGFTAIAVYLASMTLWTYGLFCSPAYQGGDEANPGHLQPGDGQQANTGTRRASSVSGAAGPTKHVLLDEEETRDTKAFLQFDRGVPALKTSQGLVEPLSDPSKVLSTARGIFRGNYPVRTEPLPPLVESLRNLLQDLGSGLAGMPSRVASRVQSQTASRTGSEER